jgi:hypothetical protein
MGDCLSTERRRVEAALARILARSGIDGERLAPLVRSCATGDADWAEYRGETCADPDEVAFAVNGGDLHDQIRFILDHCGLEEGERRLMRLAWPADAEAA